MPDRTMEPTSMTCPWSARESAAWAFCSTRRIVVPWALSSAMVAMIFCIMMGERPMEGSSSMRSLGWDMRARPMASICCSPPERVPAACFLRSPRMGEEVVGALHVLLDACRVLAEEGAELEVLGDGQAGEDPAAFGGVGEAHGDDLVGGDAVQWLAVEHDLAAEGFQGVRRGCAGWSSCRRRWCR